MVVELDGLEHLESFARCLSLSLSQTITKVKMGILMENVSPELLRGNCALSDLYTRIKSIIVILEKSMILSEGYLPSNVAVHVRKIKK